jgi:hypothetical protein
LDLPVTVCAQTSRRAGDAASEEWQHTQGEVSAREQAAGILPSTAQQNTEDRELNQIFQSLTNQQSGSVPSKPGAPR